MSSCHLDSVLLLGAPDKAVGCGLQLSCCFAARLRRGCGESRSCLATSARRQVRESGTIFLFGEFLKGMEIRVNWTDVREPASSAATLDTIKDDLGWGVGELTAGKAFSYI